MTKINGKERLRTFTLIVKQLSQKPFIVFACGVFLGFLYFSIFYGLKVVNPLFTDWLMGGGDIKQHFIGWEFYRSEPWGFPLGAIESLAYPFGISLTYTDSIPIVAILLKPFEAVLPDSFQYIGAWGLLCYMLQGGIAAIIMRRWTKNIFVILLCSVFFIIAPVFMARVFVHTALASQWILLLAIWVMLEKKRFAQSKKFILVWSCVFSLAAVIHPYFLPMVALPFFISLVRVHEEWLWTVVKGVAPFVVTIIVFWCIGGLVVKSGDAAVAGLGDYALNLNSLYNPLTSSKFLHAIPNYSTSGETLNYLGLGILLLLPVVLFVFLQKFKKISQIVDLSKKLSTKHVLIVAGVVALCILAISPSVQFGTKVLIDVDVPSKIEQYWSTFRASARLFWIVYYLIVVGVLAYIIKSWRNKSQLLLVAFLFLFTFVQVIDIGYSPHAKSKRAEFSIKNLDSYTYRSQLDINAWQQVTEGKKHMVYLGGMSNEDFFPIVDVALKYKLTMNTGYFARMPESDVIGYQADQETALLRHETDSSNLFVTKDKEIINKLRGEGYSLVDLGGFYVVN